jgi:hypothetical protein
MEPVLVLVLMICYAVEELQRLGHGSELLSKLLREATAWINRFERQDPSQAVVNDLGKIFVLIGQSRLIPLAGKHLQDWLSSFVMKMVFRTRARLKEKMPANQWPRKSNPTVLADCSANGKGKLQAP